MKLIYIVNARIPTEKAHGYQICKMCEEFSHAGCEVELWFPKRNNKIKENIFLFYGIKDNFKIKVIKSFDFLKYNAFHKLSFFLQSLFFLFKLFLRNPEKDATIYTRNPEIAYIFCLKKYKVVYEAHNWPNNKEWLYKKLIKDVDKIVVISEGLKAIYVRNGFNQKNILKAHDGVDLREFDIELSKEDARKRLNLPQDKKIVLYTGNLLEWKGVGALIDSGILLKDDFLIYLVGGSEFYVDEYKKKIKRHKNINLIKARPHLEIPVWLKAADVLVLPNSGKEKISKNYTSPLKMFEYMASRRPIVASDLPSIREILNEKNSFLILPDAPEDLAHGIKKAIENKNLSDKLSQQAFSDVKKYSWDKRAGDILRFIVLSKF